MIPEDRRDALMLGKLRALVANHFAAAGDDRFADAVPAPIGGGAGLVGATEAITYVPGRRRSPSALAAVLAWAVSNGIDRCHLVVDDADPSLVVNARGLRPAPLLWRVVGTTLEPLDGPESHESPEPPAPASAAGDQLAAAGLDVIVEHGVVVGELAGLEVARIAIDADGTAVVRVGVGLFDQEAHAVIHQDMDTPARLTVVIDQVREHRRRGAALHPLNRFSRERWLRSMVVAAPALVGCTDLAPLAPLEPRGGIHEPDPSAAIGHDEQGTVVVVCSAGIDLDLVPTAAGHVAQQHPDRVVLVLPERDRHPIIAATMSRLAAPAELRSIPEPWPT